MLLLNFAHPLTPEQLSTIERLAGKPVTRFLQVPCQLELAQPLAPQISQLLDQVGLTSVAWQSEPVLLNPPSLGAIAAALLAELHGRMGYFPPLVRLCPEPGSVPPRFQVVELLNLNQVREEARKKRGSEQPG